MRFALVILALATFTGPALAGAIHGTVQVPALGPDEPSFQPYAGHANAMPGHAMPPRGRVTDAVVSVDAIPAAADSGLPAPSGRPQLAQKDQSFVPRVVAIPVGGTVDFPNLDPIYHNVFSVSSIKRFDLGKYPRGQSRSVRFPRPGLVNVYCDIHSDMAGFILVLPNRAFARPREDGSYRLPDLPPGRYTVRWWHPDFRGGSREIVVPADGDVALDVSF